MSQGRPIQLAPVDHKPLPVLGPPKRQLEPRQTTRPTAADIPHRRLSVPQVYGQVKRFETITVEAYDLDGRGFAMDLDELPARVVQHETDHLDGVMFFDRMSETDRQGRESQIDEFVTVFRHQQSTGESPSDEELAEQLAALERDGFGG